jgi:hypothetical protein
MIPELESRTLMDMVARGCWLPTELAAIERLIRDNIAQVEAGVQKPTARIWTTKLQAYDPLLRLRWDYKQGWVIERLVREWRCWAICGVIGFHCVPSNLLDILAAGDMQRVGPGEYLQRKRAAAARKREANDKLATERVLAAVDSLSEKRIKEFISVEQAIQTGDTIVAHGATEKSLDRMRQASFRAQQEPDPPDLDRPDHPLNQRRVPNEPA